MSFYYRLPDLEKCLDKSLVRHQAEVEKYVTGTNSSHEHPSEPKNQGNSSLGPLDHHLRISQKQK